MAELSPKIPTKFIKPLIVAAAIAVLFATVLAKLGRDLWNDENYSHGLLMPFVIGYICWRERDRIVAMIGEPAKIIGLAIIVFGIVMLLCGTIGAELFTQRIALVVTITGAAVYLFGRQFTTLLLLPIALLLLAIPVPQIIFNRISFPLQLWASQIAVGVIRFVEVPTLRKGNVIEILPKGSTQTISLEVVEACSGIRSLMTLVTLSLILGYFTRTDDQGNLRFGLFSGRDLLRSLILMITAVPVAMITNAFRVAATGVMSYYSGIQATEGTLHDASGVVVYIAALVLLFAINLILKRLFGKANKVDKTTDPTVTGKFNLVKASIVPLCIMLLVGAVVVNWFALRSELTPQRSQLTQLSDKLGDWNQRGNEIKFDEAVEGLLKVSDYTMREYTAPDGRIANIYVGYYATQRTGATYHSPQNCLPGAGWVLSSPQRVEITRADGSTFTANRYIIENGIYKEVMIYWYQGRGRIEASEYRDKLNTVLDSVTRRRSDGSMVRVMTNLGHDEPASLAAASDLAARLADELPPFVPE